MSHSAEIIGAVMPGWTLLLGVVDESAHLFLSNGASSFNFECSKLYGDCKLVPDPYAGMTDAEINSVPEDATSRLLSSKHWEQVDYIESQLLSEPMIGYELVRSALQSGYDPELYGSRIASWLIGQMVRVIASKDAMLNAELRPYVLDIPDEEHDGGLQHE